MDSQAFITGLQTTSYVGIFFLSMLANVFIPVPEEVVLIGFGYLSRVNDLHVLFFILTILSGVLLSDILMYVLARKGNKLVTLFYNKLFKNLFESKGDEWISKNIYKIIFFSRFMIQFRFIGPFLAGYKKVTFKNFLMYDFLAVIVYVPLYFLLGRFFHKKIQLIISNINIVKNIILVFFALLIITSITKILYAALFGKNIKHNE